MGRGWGHDGTGMEQGEGQRWAEDGVGDMGRDRMGTGMRMKLGTRVGTGLGPGVGMQVALGTCIGTGTGTEMGMKLGTWMGAEVGTRKGSQGWGTRTETGPGHG